MSDEVLRELDHITEQLCRSEAATQNISISEDCIGAIKKVVAAQLIDNVIPDMEQFAKHANRTTMRPKDVILCARKNPKMVESLTRIVPEPKPKSKKKDK
mmetsp:Transcript_32356/g.55391  ORF Transcript_32356/g.55391 Transcript_32356/m.55391 type:complete len:100 (+) Transcript_32356:26-325(+)